MHFVVVCGISIKDMRSLHDGVVNNNKRMKMIIILQHLIEPAESK